MKQTAHHNNFRNKGLTGTYLALGLIISTITFGYIPFGYFKHLVTEGSNTFAGLTTKQRINMWWLNCLYKY